MSDAKQELVQVGQLPRALDDRVKAMAASSYRSKIQQYAYLIQFALDKLEEIDRFDLEEAKANE